MASLSRENRSPLCAMWHNARSESSKSLSAGHAESTLKAMWWCNVSERTMLALEKCLSPIWSRGLSRKAKGIHMIMSSLKFFSFSPSRSDSALQTCTLPTCQWDSGYFFSHLAVYCLRQWWITDKSCCDSKLTCQYSKRWYWTQATRILNFLTFDSVVSPVSPMFV